MRFSVATVLSGAHLAAAACSQNNCLRAVEGTAFPTRHGSADCQSYFATTITPAPATVTITAVTSVTTIYAIPPVKKRSPQPEPYPRQVTVIPSSIPAYASACSSPGAYSSACSCVGATPTTSTAPTPTTTITVASTTTVTECANPYPTFILQIENSGVVIDGVPIDGTYGQLDGGDGPLIGFNGAPIADAIVLSLNARNNLVIDPLGIIGYTDVGQGLELIHFDTPADLAAPDSDAIASVCSVAGGLLQCADDGCNFNYLGELDCQGGDNILQICPGCAVTNDLWIGQYVGAGCQAGGCVAANFVVVPVCMVPEG